MDGLARGRTTTCDGTTTLFAALNMASGTVSGACFPQHRYQEFLRFLRQLDQEYEPQLQLQQIQPGCTVRRGHRPALAAARHRAS